MNWLMQQGFHIDCQKCKLVVRQYDEKMITFNAQDPQTDMTCISYLRGSKTIWMADPVIIVSCTTEGIMESDIQQIPMVKEYTDVFAD